MVAAAATFPPCWVHPPSARQSRHQARTHHEAIPPAQSQHRVRRPQPISMLWSEGPVVLAAMILASWSGQPPPSSPASTPQRREAINSPRSTLSEHLPSVGRKDDIRDRLSRQPSCSSSRSHAPAANSSPPPADVTMPASTVAATPRVVHFAQRSTRWAEIVLHAALQPTRRDRPLPHIALEASRAPVASTRVLG